MINVLKYKIDNLIFTGDLHGNFEAIRFQIKNQKIKNSLMVFCGDIGFGFESPKHYRPILKKIDNLCEKYNNYIVFIRGNHDDPSYFDNKVVNYDRVKAVSDYTILTINKIGEDDNEIIHNILCIGGGISIDRLNRINRYNSLINHLKKFVSEEKAIEKTRKLYWENEKNVYDEDKLNEICNNFNIDIISSHTCPSFCGPKNKNGVSYWMLIDKDLSKDLDEERSTMDKIYDFIKLKGIHLKYWFYGHFHSNQEEEFDNTKFIMIDMERYSNLVFKKIIL